MMTSIMPRLKPKIPVPVMLVAMVAVTGFSFPPVGSGEPESNGVNWPQFQHDAQHTGWSPDIQQGNELKWFLDVDYPDWIYSASQVIGADGTIYFLTGNFTTDLVKLYAVKKDGTLKWAKEFGQPIWIWSFHPSCPVPSIGPDGTIYFTGWKEFFAVEPTGGLKWSFSTGYSFHSNPVVAPDGTIYIGSADDTLYALNPDGTIQWSYTVPTIPGDLDVEGTPALGPDGTVYFASGNTLYALTPNGNVKWTYDDIAYKIDQYSLTVGHNGMVYYDVFGGPGGLRAVDPGGNLFWIYYTVGNITRAAVSPDGTIYIADQGANTVEAVSPFGTLIWSYPVSPQVHWLPPIIGGDGTVYFFHYYGTGSDICSLGALNPDGTLKWKFEESPKIPASSAVIGSNGLLYFTVFNPGHEIYQLYALGKIPGTVPAVTPTPTPPPCSNPIPPGSLFGDLNDDGVVNIVDVQKVNLIAQAVLAGASLEGFSADGLCESDLDCNGTTNVTDVMIAISLALGKPLDQAIDADGNGIADACEGAGGSSGEGAGSRERRGR